MEASLLAIAMVQAKSMLTVMASSRASSLPQFFMHIGFAGVLSAVPFAGRGSGILARFVMPCWRHG
ncbi:hypothetical protein C1X61_05025 [Pseudomonas sp. FW215-T2]|nr:hypothetical protein C1X61_05025 [Pseudomonas sp. FW215-T2]PNA14383.1 hypothetical protein C1X62_08045 [Pseudomonas sp. FW215-R3]PNB38985.1 hypothetical protein C1X63_06045 [Pseudomonas sp. FW305-131]